MFMSRDPRLKETSSGTAYKPAHFCVTSQQYTDIVLHSLNTLMIHNAVDAFNRMLGNSV